MGDETSTFRTFIAGFTDFLTVAIHTILYERGIYPETSFLSARKFNFAVRQNRHPKVCEWIDDAVTAVENELYKSTVEHVVVVIYDKHNKPRERFIFDVSRFPMVPLADMDVPLERVNADGLKDTILPFVDMEEEFRATMSRLSNCSADMSPLPKGCTFTVAIELKGEGQAPVEHPQAWVPTEGQADPQARTKGQELQTTPVRAVAAGEMMFECWIEEIADQNSGDKDAPT
ncbi:related to MUS-26 MUS-26, involved in DNA repair [Lecanosticta acicola]|uniref:Related to MUS-26 MUS-26, involved in DNA repair n=1 Tax=Lecanosticta acicola TaxID=111012 RepID=A0AAI9EB00_9PEZI|nr:related to MUS-26 MUS-26, involved in DNA repair [Lecanosticta acicola]